MACDWASDVLGIRLASITMFFSSSVGLNSCPSDRNTMTLSAKTAAPTPSTTPGTCNDRVSADRYRSASLRTSLFGFSCTRPVTAIAIIAGTNVSESTNAESKAMMTVSAIGSNILPSTPENVSSGM